MKDQEGWINIFRNPPFSLVRKTSFYHFRYAYKVLADHRLEEADWLGAKTAFCAFYAAIRASNTAKCGQGGVVMVVVGAVGV